MLTQNPSLSKTLNPSLSTFQFPNLSKFSNPLRKIATKTQISSSRDKPLKIHCLSPNSHLQFPSQNVTRRRDIRAFAGRSKNNNPPGTSGGRIEGNADLRREAKRNARKRSRKMAESLFYRLKNPHRNYPDNFSEDELQMMGLGYDRMVQFMDKDDPNLRHPYDWYKYGQFGPYSWRGIVLGDPIRGTMSDECATMIGEVRDHEEWEKIERFDMVNDFGKRLRALDKSAGLRHYWVFVRHPRWRVSELPWQQWTLVCEVVIESGNERLDKWNLMGRLGNKARALITQCAAWMRPDIIYVKRPVYQCRFEPQADFFKGLAPLVDPETENEFLFELENDDGKVEVCTYFAGLCKIVKVNQKAFVDDVVKGYEKLSDEKKSKCLDFLLTNHPLALLHPYTKEWKAKLEEMELGCDAPDDNEDADLRGSDDNEVTEWVEDDGEDDDGHDEDDIVLDMDEDGVVDAEGDEDEYDVDVDDEEEEYWENEFKAALSSNEAMENLAKRSMDRANKVYNKQLKGREGNERRVKPEEEGDELELRGRRAKVDPAEWKRLGFSPHRRRIRKSKVPPGIFLRAAVRPFSYRNLVKEIVLTRHGIIDGDIGAKK